MKNDTLYHKIDMLPDVLKTEANTFIDYLLYKSNKKLKKKERKPGFLKGKISIILLFICIFCSYPVSAKWTVIDSTFDSSLKLSGGFVDGIVFDELDGYYFRGYGTLDQIYHIYHSTDRGFTWTSAFESKGGWDSLKGEDFCNVIYESLVDKCLTHDNLFAIFDLADQSKYAYHKIDDSTLTKNAVILKMDRKTNKYEMFDTKINEKIKALNMIDDQYGIVAGHKSLYRTEDGCQTFQKIFSTDTISNWYFMDGSSPTKNDYYFLFGNNQRQSQLCFTNDAGETWNFKSMPDSCYFINSIGSGKVFCTRMTKKNLKLLFTEDNFESFISILDTTTPELAWTGNLFIKDSLYFLPNIYTTNAFVSFNSGKSWTGADSVALIGSPAGQILRDGSIIDNKTIVMIDWNGTRLFVYERNKPVSVRDLPNAFKAVNLYPNPLPRSKTLNINLKCVGVNTKLKVKIIDITGKEIDEFSSNAVGVDMYLQYLPAESIPSGTYFLVIESDEGILAKEKFMIE